MSMQPRQARVRLAKIFRLASACLASSWLAAMAMLTCTHSDAYAQGRDLLGQFTLAARADDRGFVQRMPRLGLDHNTRDALRNNLLMLAIRENGNGLALELLKQPAWQARDVLEYENRLGETALMLAAISGSVPVASRLIELGAEVNRTGWSPLHYAASAGKLAMVRLLMERSAYVDAASPNGTTPLMMASRFNHRPTAQLLVNLGADPTLTNEAGFTARDYARQNNNSDLAFWLEMEEISFVNRYLANLPKADPRDDLESAVRRSGGDLIIVNPDGSTSVMPIEPSPRDGVEVFQGIR